MVREYKRLSQNGWEDVHISALEPGDVICIYDNHERHVDFKGNNVWTVQQKPYQDKDTNLYYVEVLEDYGDSVLV
ncbi:hypothetical protein_gp286 [Bacillus phage vB_BceM_WH1]|nr:hypothetical protein_gp286 [Bacillus phage vB_BceM_WH1]